MIVTKTGKNVFPEELEAALGRTPYIAEALVYAAENKKRGGALISAQIRPDLDAIRQTFGAVFAADEQQVFRLMREAVMAYNAEVANYKRIRYIQIRQGALARTPTKKVIRSRNV